jgi:hypothetical protein
MRSPQLTPEAVQGEIDRLKRQITTAEGDPNFDRDLVLNLERDEAKEQIETYTALLKEYDSHLLIQEAVRWGIDVPHRPEWHTELKDTDPHTMPKRRTMIWLNDTGRSVVSKQIRDARFAYWKGWAEILVPVLALLVAIIALLK